MMKILTFLLVGSVFSVSAQAANMWKTVYEQLDLGGLKTPNEKVHIECHFDLLSVNLTKDHDVTKLKMNKAPNRKRCEFAIQDVVKRDTPFKFSFDFKTNDNFAHYSQWHSYFQLHSVPDQGEAWRCPIMALESVNGTLRMFNRWDENQISVTKNGSCGGAGNSIEYRKLFSDYYYEADSWYNVEISGELSHNKDACLTVKINDEVLSDVCGPNTFNDIQKPYIKFGIYKPTSWEVDNEEIELSVKNIRYHELAN
ncbi:heparin lyase I family protein [Vibrio penaeicida]|uniref:heparin lyase I family protein n=1 Tax=Vibrio penaeicida TaxID=104609 RepID=UPI000CE9C117|nr:heparin lyase I family protein [Vibrio penaeicida]